MDRPHENKIWKQIPYKREIAELLYKTINISFQLSIILAQRGIHSTVAAEHFLFPKLTYLEDPLRITHMEEGVELLSRVIDHHLSVAIVGDYDVDGITSITLLTNVLKNFGVYPDFYVPKRAAEGYGFSREIIDRALSHKHYDVFIALDCGTNSVEEVSFLKSQKIEALVVDHHQAKNVPIVNCCIINPNAIESFTKNDSGILCTVGLVFKLCYALLKRYRRQNDPRAVSFFLKNHLDLVTLGTIADMAPMVGENRIMCKFGLKILNGLQRRPGIEALCKTSGIPPEISIRQPEISFKLCPRLNACGRITDAVLPVKMMLSDDFDEALTYAYELDETNHERQLIEREITEQAEQEVQKKFLQDSGLVLYNESWNSGVVGIVSGKFTRDYARPAVVLGGERGLAKGSGRSANGINLIEILTECSDLLETWGGHPYAVGISLETKNIDAFRERFNKAIARYKQRNVVAQSEIVEYSCRIGLEDIDSGFMQEHDLLQPFGQQNANPVFLLPNIKIQNLPEKFGAQKSHVKFWLSDKHSRRMLVIGWGMSDNIPPVGVRLDLLVTVSREIWKKMNSTCLVLVDWKVAK